MAYENDTMKMKALADAIEEKKKPDGSCLIGFDGYIDELYSVVQKRMGPEEYTAYDKIEDFGRRILWASGKSADLEICPHKIKFGGNAPILANTLASLNYRTTCIGQLDTDGGDSPFAKMHPCCKRISTGKASRTIALEFRDGKIMLGNLQGSHTGWEEIREKTGAGRLSSLVEESSLIGMVNWGGMYRMNEIMEGMAEKMLFPMKAELKRKKDIFLDLADPSARPEGDMERLFALIRRLAGDFRVTVGMNENEAGKIGDQFCGGEESMEETGEKIRKALHLNRLVIHTNHRVFGFADGLVEEYAGMHVENPVQTTGAGDHFNAGFCLGILENRSLYENLVLGQATASCYISTGKTPDRAALADYIRKHYHFIDERKNND